MAKAPIIIKLAMRDVQYTSKRHTGAEPTAIRA